MYSTRKGLYQAVEDEFNTKLIVYITGDRSGWECQMHQEVIDFFVRHLDSIGDSERITLLIYTRGGSTMAAWSLANLIRSFCDNFDVIIPAKCLSAGTILCLGADSIMMTKQATLGPIDPSVNGPLNPQIPGAPTPSRAPVSVEAINGFIQLAMDRLNIHDDADLAKVLVALSDHVHPLVIGDAFRVRDQIRMVGKKLLSLAQMHDDSDEKIETVLQFLCSESGSHDYTINRREAKEELGLKVVKPNSDQYNMIKAIYDDIANDLDLMVPFVPAAIVGTNDAAEYMNIRALVESLSGGSHSFVSEGRLSKMSVQGSNGMPVEQIQDARTYEGWRYTNE